MTKSKKIALQIVNGKKGIQNGSSEIRYILDGIDLKVYEGDFVTVLGGNGAGKSTLFNAIAGNILLDSGSILLNNKDITMQKEEQRAKFIARVFQDPKMGTAPRMTVAENLLLALNRGKTRSLFPRALSKQYDYFEQLCSLIGNGLEKHMDTPTGNLSGGQRQSLSLLMSTMTKPELLLLDEHTAALDPKTSKQLMSLTAKQIKEHSLTCLMITHRMEDALIYGNRLIVMQKGRVKLDLSEEEKKRLTLQDLLLFFEE